MKLNDIKPEYIATLIRKGDYSFEPYSESFNCIMDQYLLYSEYGYLWHEDDIRDCKRTLKAAYILLLNLTLHEDKPNLKRLHKLVKKYGGEGVLIFVEENQNV